jgi:hypothetical protein
LPETSSGSQIFRGHLAATAAPMGVVGKRGLQRSQPNKELHRLAEARSERTGACI